MALESRNGRVYYYTSQRVGGAVVRRYWGSGQLARSIAEYDAQLREDKKLRALDRKDRANRRAARAAELRDWLARVNEVVAEALTAAGWHRHHRGEWRKKRGATMTTTTTQPRWYGPELAEASGTLDPATAAKAEKGDRSVTAAVDEFLSRPAAAALWGDLGRRVLQRWVAKFAGSNLLTERALLRFAADLRDRLAGPHPDPLVQLVAERVVVAWVAANYVEHRYHLVFEKLLGLPAQHRVFLAEIELMNRNLMSACRTLAKVKKARLPDVLALVKVVPPLPAGDTAEAAEAPDLIPVG
jgi:hypothetical protein